MNKEIIWYNKELKPADFDWLHPNTLGEALGIRFAEIGPDYIKATMPVDKNTKQPFGLLHGGASAALAETMGSVASWLIVNPEFFIGVGIEINANHVRSVKEGKVTGVCTPLHVGGKTHVWDVKIYDDKEQLCCVSRVTVAIIPKNRV
ncbi:MAG TPA: hotdog fold thioesterase [Bacteroidia bacterium]|jgi:1,4-dihydroxy-2-naphthoyl-CoA hydrolase|nr:hotdog fold thioesterase [Bacteroidia bacterium]